MLTLLDITVIISVRLHENNSWVVDRLRLLSKYYIHRPNFLIVDFGSQGEYKNILSNECDEAGFEYIYVDDAGIFSLSAARNRGVEYAQTKLVMLSDIDFFFERNIFERLVTGANALNLETKIDVVFNFAAYHLNEAESSSFFQVSDEDKSLQLFRIGYESVLQDLKTTVEFIAPYSNVYLMRKDLFKLVGGYHESFRGHGSEDFEFFVRLAMHTKLQPIPDKLTEDKYGATKKDFYDVKAYEGFRRLNESLSMPSELMGFKAFHLWHPTRTEGDWRSENDWKRDKFNKALDHYKNDEKRLLDIDFFKREKLALCVCKHSDHYGYMTPLRLADYGLHGVYDDSDDSIAQSYTMIDEGLVDAFVIFNPYMKSHQKFYPLYLLAKEKGIETIVIERGALPASIYYASDVSYNALEFSINSFESYLPSGQDIELAEKYIQKIKSGDSLLEASGSYSATKARYEALSQIRLKKVFVPLQIDDDMAVTKFIRDAQIYHEFLSSFNEVARKNKDVLFLVKKHPLSKEALNLYSENIIEAQPEDNVHCLIDICDSVVCYNSGVGLLALMHEKPTITIGNAFYNVPNTGCFANTFAEALDKSRIASGPDRNTLLKLVSWFVNVRYSFFNAQDDIKEFGDRKAHSYKNILVNELKLDGKIFYLGRLQQIISKTNHNYIFSKLNVKKVNHIKETHFVKPTQLDSMTKKQRLRRKLRRDPFAYFRDSSIYFLRPISIIFSDNKFGAFNRGLIKRLVK